MHLKHAEITYLFNDTYLLQFEDDLVDAIEIDGAFIQLVNNKKFSVILDTRNKYSSITNEARHFFATDPNILPLRRKIAIVVNNMPTKLLANFFIQFNKPQTPTKLFTDYEKAIEWFK